MYIDNKVAILMNHYPLMQNTRIFLKKDVKKVPKECLCEIELHLPGKQLFASSDTHHFEGAVKETFKQLSYQFDKAKEKLLVHH